MCKQNILNQSGRQGNIRAGTVLKILKCKEYRYIKIISQKYFYPVQIEHLNLLFEEGIIDGNITRCYDFIQKGKINIGGKEYKYRIYKNPKKIKDNQIPINF